MNQLDNIPEVKPLAYVLDRVRIIADPFSQIRMVLIKSSCSCGTEQCPFMGQGATTDLTPATRLQHFGKLGLGEFTDSYYCWGCGLICVHGRDEYNPHIASCN
jgi:hypothetical protein